MPEHAEPEAEGGSPATPVLAAADDAHLLAEAAIDGETAATSWGGLTAHMGHEAVEIMAGEGTAMQTGMMGASAVMGPVAIAGGIMEMIEGRKEWQEGRKADGAVSMGAGGLGVSSGVAGLAGLAGAGPAAAAAPLLASSAVGLKVGHFGDNEVKKMGVLHNDEGEAESASEWAGENGKHADAWVTKHLHSGALGTIAGLGATLGSVFPAAGMSMAGAVMGGYSLANNAGHAIGTGLAHHHRASHYESAYGMSEKDAQGLADYDDGQAAAIERSKREHPERWATPKAPGYFEEKYGQQVHDRLFGKK